MSERETLATLNQLGAIVTDTHVIYTSGKHGSTYINKDAIYPHTKQISSLCRAIAQEFAEDQPEVVLAPALGGIILSQWIAHHLSELMTKEVLAIYAEKSETGDSFVIKRGYEKLIAHKRVLMTEDVINTGKSISQVIGVAQQLQGIVIGLGVLCNRGNLTTQDLLNIPKLFALVNLPLETWEAQDCPLCQANIPINTSLGKGAKSLTKS